MKRIMSLVIVCLCFSAVGFASGFCLRIGGGATYILGGDYANVVQGRNDFYASLAGATESSQLSPMHVAANIDLELAYEASDYVGLGIGFGYIHATNDSKVAATFPANQIISVFTPLATCTYLAPNLHLSVPLNEVVRLHLSGGPGLYWASFKYDNGFSSTVPDIQETLSFDSTRMSAVGFQATLGVELRMTDSVSACLDAVGRSVVFEGPSGPFNLSGEAGGVPVGSQSNGTFWYHETLSNGVYYPDWTLSPDMPTGSDVRNARKFRLSLGGIGIRASLKINL